MSSNKKKISLIVCVILFGLFGLVLNEVVAADFIVTNAASPDGMCPGSTGLFTDVVKNTGTSDISISIMGSGSASAFATTVPYGFVLKPGKERTIYTYVSPKSTTKIGQYTLDISVSSNGDTETIPHAVNIKDCFEFVVQAKDKTKSLCPGYIEKYDFVVENLGQYSSNYALGVTGQASEWVELSEEKITLGPGESKEVFAYVTVPSDSLGDYDFNVVAASKGVVASDTATVEVLPCFDYNVKPEKNFLSFCEHSIQTIPVTIENRGSVVNFYDLEIDGPDWANIEQRRIEISAGGSKNVNLMLNPDYGVEGNFEVKLKAITDKGKIGTELVFNINVKKCHAVLIDIRQERDKICNSLTSNYDVVIKNTGEFEKDFKFVIDGPVWVKLDRSSVKLAPGEEEILNLEVSPGFDTEVKEFDVKLQVMAMDTSKVMSEDKIVIETVAREDCYRPSVGLESKGVSVSYDGSATIPVVIENKGTYKAEYNVGISGTASSFVELNPAVVEVEPDKSEVVYLYVAPSGEIKDGDYTATISVRLGDSGILASDTVTISVVESAVGAEEFIPGAEETTEEVEAISIWDRIKNFFSKIFGRTPSVEEINEETEEVEDLEDVDGEEETEEAEEVVSLNLDEGESVNELMAEGDVATLMINEEEHEVTLNELAEGSVVLVIESEPIFVLLADGEVQEVDIDGDGVNDLRVTYNGMVDGKADLTYDKIMPSEEVEEVVEEEVPEEVIEEEVVEETPEEVVEDGTVEEEVTEEVTGETEEVAGLGVWNSVKVYKGYIIAGIIILIIIILIIRTSFHKKIVDFFEEEIEEEEEEKKEVKKEVKKEIKQKEIKKKETKKKPKKKEIKEEDEYY